MTRAPIELLFELSQVGVEIDDLWELVNTRESYDEAVPVLVDWLAHLDERVPWEVRSRVEEPIVRALTVPGARKLAPPVLIDRFRLPEVGQYRAVRWAIGNALGGLAGDQYFDELEALARDRAYGRDREQLLRFFGRSKDPRAVRVLWDLLDEDDIAAHAAEALGRQKDPRSRVPLEKMLTHERPLVRREAAKALKKLNQGVAGMDRRPS
ncbi:HEAT repeat domain-containing protein [Leifsonia sp. NPDC056824]|uniref:HEAT repeat domain-containing protein n=1 Tax=Leifsonia sp. NPDC056824 TaxID=3345953 RepID=UPI0036C52010